jgi:putative SOS response-associated peptidase YedK
MGSHLHWSKDPSIASSTINAKSETAAIKPAFRDPLKLRRCLIPADGFYEWKRRGTAKQPYCFEVDNGELYAFAGIWDGWKNATGQWVKTLSILTTTPNSLTATIHDRMPVILDPDSYNGWLNPTLTNVNAVSELLNPYDARLMRCYPVSTRINHMENDDEECCRSDANSSAFRRFIRGCHYGWDVAQHKISNLVIDYEQQVRKLKKELRESLRNRDKEKIERNKRLITCFETRQIVLRRLADTILYHLFKMENWIPRRMMLEYRIHDIEPDTLRKTVESASVS